KLATGREDARFEILDNRNQYKPLMTNGELVISEDYAADEGMEISFWQPRTQKLVKNLRSRRFFAETFSVASDGKTVALGGHRYLDGNNFQHEIDIVDLNSGKWKHRLQGHNGQITCLAFANNGKTLVSGSVDSTILVWKLDD